MVKNRNVHIRLISRTACGAIFCVFWYFQSLRLHKIGEVVNKKSRNFYWVQESCFRFSVFGSLYSVLTGKAALSQCTLYKQQCDILKMAANDFSNNRQVYIAACFLQIKWTKNNELESKEEFHRLWTRSCLAILIESVFIRCNCLLVETMESLFQFLCQPVGIIEKSPRKLWVFDIKT